MYRVEDYSAVREVLEAEGKARVVVASMTLTPCKPGTWSKEGPPVKPDLTLAQVRAQDFDALVLLGGGVFVFLSDTTPERGAIDTLIRDMLAANKYVAASTEGQRLIGELGHLQGKKAALDPTMIALFAKRKINPGAIIEPGATVVADGNIITASGWEHSAELGRLLLKKLDQAP
jgi:putative intracellular protease/amidase